jgi:hypothetical protein
MFNVGLHKARDFLYRTEQQQNRIGLLLYPRLSEHCLQQPTQHAVSVGHGRTRPPLFVRYGNSFYTRLTNNRNAFPLALNVSSLNF